MFNKSLFKQSCKANGTMWIIITVAVCFMLCCVMLIAGGDSLSQTKNSIQNTIIEGELKSQTEKRALSYYTLSAMGLKAFDDAYSKEYEKVKSQVTEEKAHNLAYAKGETAMNNYVAQELENRGIKAFSQDGLELKLAMNTIFNKNGKYNSTYIDNNEVAPTYDAQGVITMHDSKRAKYRLDYAMTNSGVVLASTMVDPANIELVLQELNKYGVDKEEYKKFGYTNYNNVKTVAMGELVNFRGNFDYRVSHMQEGETEEGIIRELAAGAGQSLLSSLPKAVGDALEEIGQADLYGILVGSIFFKMAGLLLPIIYLIMTANALIAGQVDSGSMAYILASSVKRRTVTFTQAIYLVGSLLAMFLCTSVTSMICLACVHVETALTYGNLLLINLGAFLVMFAMSGICFLASCWFNRSKHSMAIGGGINMFFLVATMLGLFGSSILPSIIRMKALNMFNYVSIISLFDVISIIEGSLTYLWKFAILIVIGVVGYVIGNEKFIRKDLPL